MIEVRAANACCACGVQVFFDGKSKKRVGDREIESFSLFKDGIK